MSLLASFGDYNFIASQQVDILGAGYVLTEAYPKQRRPGDHGGEKALHGAIATPLAGPAGQSQPCNTSCDDQESDYDPAQKPF